MVIVTIVSLKQKQLQIFFLGVSNYCESSLLLTSLLPWWFVLGSNTEDAKVCAPTDSSESLLRWVYIEVS